MKTKERIAALESVLSRILEYGDIYAAQPGTESPYKEAVSLLRPAEKKTPGRPRGRAMKVGTRPKGKTLRKLVSGRYVDQYGVLYEVRDTATTLDEWIPVGLYDPTKETLAP